MASSEQVGRAATGVPVIDYEGSAYRTDFWEGQGRAYEDAVERLALAALLPPTGRRIVEIGAGFGRLADLYSGYRQVILFDYSRTLLQEAVARWGQDERFVFVAGNVYEMPLASAALDTVAMVRVMHHLADVAGALAQIRRVMHRESVAVLEYANKRNAKAILRWLMGRQGWSPFAPDPFEFVALNFDFHPAWMQARLEQAGLRRRRQWAVSHLRVPALKRAFSAHRLAELDWFLFRLGEWAPLSPSVFVQVDAPGAGAGLLGDAAGGSLAGLFRCPRCAGESMAVMSDEVQCEGCSTRYVKRLGVWDFKEPAS
jgi:ubiquinone/menaquinone biosynthesis C-methylase UbiE